jgi:RHS repeat-associated protein
VIPGKRWSSLVAVVLAALLFAPAALASIPSAADLALAPRTLPELAPTSIEATTEPESCGVFCQQLEVRLEAGLFGGGEPSVVALDAWGNYRNPAELEASKNRFGFTGHLFDRETGTYYAKARYFDPELGRFLTQDSYLGEIDNPPSLHRFLYANANPTSYVDEDGHSATAVGTAVGFAWGLGQAVGGLIDDTWQGKRRSAGEYFGIVASNTAGGALIGASIDATVLTGGLGAATVGALGGAGSSLITMGGESRGLGESFERAGVGAATGAIGGVAFSKVAPLVGRVAEWASGAAEHVPLLQKVAVELGKAGGAVLGKAGQLASRYEGGKLGRLLGRAANPFEGLAGKPLPAATSTAVTITEGSGGASAGTQAAVKPAVQSGPPGGAISPGARLRAQYGDTFEEYMRHRAQGFTAKQAKYLTEPYDMSKEGHHFFPKRLGKQYGVSQDLMNSPFNVVKPQGITRGRFYERHFLADPHFAQANFPRRIGGMWRGEDIGLVKPGFFGRLPYAIPDRLGTLGSGWGGTGAAQAFSGDQDERH